MDIEAYGTSQSSLEWQYVAYLLKTSAAMGTVELTGLEMMATQACGQYLATAAHKSRTMPAACNLGMLLLLSSGHALSLRWPHYQT